MGGTWVLKTGVNPLAQTFSKIEALPIRRVAWIAIHLMTATARLSADTATRVAARQTLCAVRVFVGGASLHAYTTAIALSLRSGASSRAGCTFFLGAKVPSPRLGADTTRVVAAFQTLHAITVVDCIATHVTWLATRALLRLRAAGGFGAGPAGLDAGTTRVVAALVVLATVSVDRLGTPSVPGFAA